MATRHCTLCFVVADSMARRCDVCGKPADQPVSRRAAKVSHAIGMVAAALALTPLLGRDERPDWVAALVVTSAYVAFPVLIGWIRLTRSTREGWVAFCLILGMVLGPSTYMALRSHMAMDPKGAPALSALPTPPSAPAHFVVRPPLRGDGDGSVVTGSVLSEVLEVPEAPSIEPSSLEERAAVRAIVQASTREERQALDSFNRDFALIPVRDAVRPAALSTPDGVERAKMVLRDLRMQVQRQATATSQIHGQATDRLRPLLTGATPKTRQICDTVASLRRSVARSVEEAQLQYIQSLEDVVAYLDRRPATDLDVSGVRSYDAGADRGEFDELARHVVERSRELDLAIDRQAHALSVRSMDGLLPTAPELSQSL